MMMNEKLTKQVSVSFSEQEYAMLFDEVIRLRKETGNYMSVGKLIRGFISDDLDILRNGDSTVSSTEPHTDKAPDASNYDFGDISDISINGE